MACNCNHTNDCNTAVDCSCGVQLDIYQNGLMIDSVVFTGHEGSIPEYPSFICFDDIAISPSPTVPCYMNFSQINNAWEIYYIDGTTSTKIVLGLLPSSSTCPLSQCEWNTECLSLLLLYGEGQYLNLYSNGSLINGYHTFEFDANILGTFSQYVIYFNTTSGKWTLKDTILNEDVGQINELNLSCPIGSFRDIDTDVELDVYTQNVGSSGYVFKTSAVECGCCDEQIEITMTVQTPEGFTENVYTAEIAKDEYGNTLALNGKPYYFFEVDGEMYFVLFDGTSWVIQTDCDNDYRITEEEDYRRTEYYNLRKLN